VGGVSGVVMHSRDGVGEGCLERMKGENKGRDVAWKR